MDSTIWIDFLNSVQSAKVETLVNLMEEDRHICVTPTIIQEVLQGISADEEFERIQQNLLSYTVLVEDNVTSAIEAAKIYRQLRKKGITIRKSADCLIAWYALQNGASLLQNDRDFELIAKIYPLKLS